jgi:predicted N-formylglutamate amidohydrolase
MSLLTPDEPAPFTVINGDATTPLLIVCDHASNRVPAALDNLGLEQDILEQHVGWDIGAAAVAQQLAERLDATAVLAGYSRLVIDANRAPDDPTAVPEVSDDIPIPGNKNLSAEDRAARVDGIYTPYHRRIAAQLDRLGYLGAPPAFFSVHSFTPSMGGLERPWHIGVLWHLDPRIPEPLIKALRAHPDGLTVGDNEPYSGYQLAHTLDHHAGAQGFAHSAVEIRQDEIDTPEKQAYWADVLADCLEPILRNPVIHRVQHY